MLLRYRLTDRDEHKTKLKCISLLVQQPRSHGLFPQGARAADAKTQVFPNFSTP